MTTDDLAILPTTVSLSTIKFTLPSPDPGVENAGPNQVARNGKNTAGRLGDYSIRTEEKPAPLS
jgi:hypothetical protein